MNPNQIKKLIKERNKIKESLEIEFYYDSFQRSKIVLRLKQINKILNAYYLVSDNKNSVICRSDKQRNHIE